MTDLLFWRHATLEDAHDLKHNFCCTLPKEGVPQGGGRRAYPSPPEARAQSIVKTLNVPKAARTGQRIWVGRDLEGVAAVAAWRWVDQDMAMVDVVALSLRVRGNGFTYSNELVDTAAAQVGGEAAERGLEEVSVVTYIHADNRASRAFAKRFGMDQTTDPDSQGYALHSVVLGFGELA